MAVSTTTPCAAPRRRPKCLALLTILAAAWLPACAAEPDSPEAQIRALLQQAEAAAEEKNVGALKQLLSESYSDDHGQDSGQQAVARCFHGVSGFVTGRGI